MVDLKLVSYIKENLSKGYTKEELKQILKENGWSALEIDEAFERLEKPQQQVATQKPMQQKPVEVPSELVSFVRQAFQKGIDESKVRSALSAKGWPPETINKAISLGKPKQELRPQQEIKQQVMQQPKEIKQEFKQPKPIKEKGPKSPKNVKRILMYILSGIILMGIFTLTIGLYYNVEGITNYKIVDPTTGKEYYGRCLTADCAAMKDFAWNNVITNMYLILGISGVLALAGVLLFAFLKGKRQIVVWIYNIAYLLFLIFIAYVWFSFRIAYQ